MATKAQSTADEKDFADSFNSDVEKKPEMTEDEAFGISPEGTEVGASANTEAPTDTPAEEVAAEAVTPAPEGESAQTNETAAETPTEEVKVDEAKAEDAPVENTGMSFEDAKQLFANDFGEEYVEALLVLIAGASKPVADHSQTITDMQERIQGLIDDIANERTENHFARIKEAHEDFQDLAETPEFIQWIESNPDKENIQRIVQSGSAKEIISMLNDFKASQKPAEPDGDAFEWDDESMAAEGVRSSGVIKLPEPPKDGQSYEDAWNEK